MMEGHRPRIEPDENGKPTIKLGAILASLLAIAVTTGLGAMTTVSVLAYRADASEDDVQALTRDVARQGRNQATLDEQIRRVEQDSAWANRKLDRLLEEQGVTERIQRPPRPPSELERRHEESP